MDIDQDLCCKVMCEGEGSEIPKPIRYHMHTQIRTYMKEYEKASRDYNGAYSVRRKWQRIHEAIYSTKTRRKYPVAHNVTECIKKNVERAYCYSNVFILQGTPVYLSRMCC